MKKKIAIIGAGWTGLSAAVTLVSHADVTLFEAGNVAGGRARAVQSRDFSFLDNGQHLLIDAYQATFDLLKTIGVAQDEIFFRQPFQWYLADGVQFQASTLPAPFDLLSAVIGAKNARLPEKIALLKHIILLKKWYKQKLPDQSVLSWLDTHHVSQKWMNEFWQPLVLGILNTPLHEASLRVLSNVFNDVFFTNKPNHQYYFTRVDLGQVLAEPALQYILQHGATWQPKTRVSQLHTQDSKVQVNGQWFDAVIVATAPYHVVSLLPETLGLTVREAVEKLKYCSITTVYLKYPHKLNLPAIMTGFADATAQWLIDRSHLNGANEVAAVVSASDALSGSPKNANDWAKAIHADVLRVCPNAPQFVSYQVITEKRATIMATVNRQLPRMDDLHAVNIYLAGDWLHSRYPATLESAVQSGQNIAKIIISKGK